MIDSRKATQVAFYAALSTAPGVISLADVWAPPPEGTEPSPSRGVVIVGLASIANAAGKDGGLDDVEIEVQAYTRTPDPTDLYALATAVRNALELRPVAAPGALLSPPEFISADPDLMEDGKTFVDTLRFRTFVQAA